MAFYIAIYGYLCGHIIHKVCQIAIRPGSSLENRGLSGLMSKCTKFRALEPMQAMHEAKSLNAQLNTIGCVVFPY